MAFIDDLVDLLANTLNAAVVADLANDEPVVPGAAKRKLLVNGLRAVSDDLIELERAQLGPAFLDGLQSDTRLWVLRFWNAPFGTRVHPAIRSVDTCLRGLLGRREEARLTVVVVQLILFHHFRPGLRDRCLGW